MSKFRRRGFATLIVEGKVSEIQVGKYEYLVMLHLNDGHYYDDPPSASTVLEL